MVREHLTVACHLGHIDAAAIALHRRSPCTMPR